MKKFSVVLTCKVTKESQIHSTHETLEAAQDAVIGILSLVGLNVRIDGATENQEMVYGRRSRRLAR